MSTKDLKVKQETSVAKKQPKQELQIDPSDIIISKIIVAQALSEVVKNGDVKPGEIYESSESQVLAGKGDDLDLIMLNVKKSIYVFEGEKGQEEFKTIEPYTEFYDYEKRVDGKLITRHKCISFMCINYNDVKDGHECFPYIINFMKTNYNTGRKIVTQIAKAQTIGIDFTKKIFSLRSKTMTFGKHSWFGWDVTASRQQVTDSEHKIIANWAKHFASVDIQEQQHKEEDIAF